MSTIVEIFQQSLLAEAAYARFSNFANTKGALVASGMSDSQADAFVAKWTVVHHIPDTTSGFSATLFQNNAGEYSLAIRGSTPDSLGVDFLADAGDIFLDGIVLDQLVDMYNYWQHLRSPVGIYEAKKLVTLQVETAALRAAYLLSDAAGAESRARSGSNLCNVLKCKLYCSN